MESVTVDVRCSRSARQMRVRFSRSDSAWPFSVDDVVPGSSVSASVAGTRLLSGEGKAQPKKAIRVDAPDSMRSATEFDWFDFGCIFCEGGTFANVAECGSCGALICGGTLRQKGRDRVEIACGVCGAKSSGRSGQPIEWYSARRAAPQTRSLAPGVGGLLERGRRLLPGGDRDTE